MTMLGSGFKFWTVVETKWLLRFAKADGFQRSCRGIQGLPQAG